MTDEDIKTGCEQIHQRLQTMSGRAWRLPTWEKKYAARLRKYGLDDCMTAIMGFCAQPWYMNNQSQNAPDLIFRSDRQFEKFLAFGKHERESLEADRNVERRARLAKDGMAATRERLEHEHADLNERLRRKLLPLREEICEQSWTAFIAPLLYATRKDGTIVLFHEQCRWVKEHYGERIEEILGRTVAIVDFYDQPRGEQA